LVSQRDTAGTDRDHYEQQGTSHEHS